MIFSKVSKQVAVFGKVFTGRIEKKRIEKKLTRPAGRNTVMGIRRPGKTRPMVSKEWALVAATFFA
jgi:hypothetical protein